MRTVELVRLVFMYLYCILDFTFIVYLLTEELTRDALPADRQVTLLGYLDEEEVETLASELPRNYRLLKYSTDLWEQLVGWEHPDSWF